MTRSRLVLVLGVALIAVLHIYTVHALQLVRIADLDADHRDNFGGAVSIVQSPTGEIVAVGASSNNIAGVRAGAVHVFARDAGGPDAWGRVATLRSADIEEDDAFGASVAAGDAGRVIVAGAPQAGGGEPGAAYVFTGDAGVWTQFAKLEPDDGSIGDRFGTAVSIGTGVGAPVIVVGALGSEAAYVFEPDPTAPEGWRQVARLVPDDLQPGSSFGYSVAASEDVVVVGAPGVGGTTVNTGAAYIFSRNRDGLGRWGQVARLVKTNQGRGLYPSMRSAVSRSVESDRFGTSVAIAGGGVVVVGAPWEDGPDQDTGAAYVFYRGEGGPDAWGQVAEITASGNARPMEEFGASVAIAGNRILVGAPANLADRVHAGAVYLFVRDQGGEDAWGRQSWFRAGDETSEAVFFGRAVSLSGGDNPTGVAGAPTGLGEVGRGAAFILEHLATLQTHTPRADSFLRRNEPNRNEGANPVMRVKSSGINRAVVGFAELPNVERLTSATLVLTIAGNFNNWGRDGRTVEAFRITPFLEGNGVSAGVLGLERTRGEGAGITWNCWVDLAIENHRPDCGMAGEILDPIADPVLHRNGLLGEVAWDVTADVRNRTFAWMIRRTDERRAGEVWYYTKEAAVLLGNPDLAPRLVLDFEPLPSEPMDARHGRSRR